MTMMDMPDMKRFVLGMKVFVAVMAVFIVGSIGYIAYRSFVNDDRCVAALGDGAKWDGQDQCTPPPVHLDNLK